MLWSRPWINLPLLSIQLLIHGSPSTPHLFPTIPSSIPLKPPSTRPFSFIISPSSIDCCSQTGSCWKSSNSGLPLSHPAVNNEIKVTNCQEVVKLRLPLMCVCVCARKSLCGHAWHKHTPETLCMTHLMSLKFSNAHSASSEPSRDH